MDNFLLQAHSGWRWIVLVLIVITALKMLVGWLGRQKWTSLDANLLFYSRIAIYIQVVLGLIIYIMSQKWLVGIGFVGSHVIPGLLAVGGVEFGAARARKSSGSQKFMFGFIGFVVALILVFGTVVAVARPPA